MNPRRLILWFYALLIVAAVAISGRFFFQTREEYEHLRRTEATNRQLVTETQARLAAQEKYLERLRTDPSLVEKVIRQRLGYARPDEYVFRFEE